VDNGVLFRGFARGAMTWGVVFLAFFGALRTAFSASPPIPYYIGPEVWEALDRKVAERDCGEILTTISVYPVHPGHSSLRRVQNYAELSSDLILMNSRAVVLKDQGTVVESVNGIRERSLDVASLPRPGSNQLYRSRTRVFEHLNLFYHADRTVAYFERLGFETLGRPMMLYAARSLRSTAVYHRSVGVIHLLDGPIRDGFQSFLKDASVVAHEITHAVVDRTTINRNPKNLVHAAMEEGYADYFAAAIQRHPAIAEYASGRNRNWIRDLRKRPVISHPEPHQIGHVFASELWRFRERAMQLEFSGIEIDRAVFRSIEVFNDADATFKGAVDLLVKALPKSLYGFQDEWVRGFFSETLTLDDRYRGYLREGHLFRRTR